MSGELRTKDGTPWSYTWHASTNNFLFAFFAPFAIFASLR